MTAPGLKVDDRELRRAIDKVQDELGEVSSSAVVVVRGLLPGVVSRTPRLTGTLAGSWEEQAVAGGAAISSSLDYAAPVEYGVPARAIPAARMVADTIAAEERAIVEGFEQEIARAARSAGFEVRT